MGLSPEDPDKNKGRHGLIGFFTDDDGQRYFMITNVYHATNASSADTEMDFIIEFDKSVTELVRLERITGQPKLIRLGNYALKLRLPGGTGDLFKYNTGDFAGL